MKTCIRKEIGSKEMSDVKEYCGLFGIYGCEDAAERVYYGLYSLQHRGKKAPELPQRMGRTSSVIKEWGLLVK